MFLLMLLYSCFILHFSPVYVLYVSYISIVAVVVVVLQSSLYSFHILLVSYSKLVLFSVTGDSLCTYRVCHIPYPFFLTL